MEKFIAKVNFAQEILEKKSYDLVIAKITNDTGVLTWLGDSPTQYGRSVVIRLEVCEGNFLTLKGSTVGHLYGVNVRNGRDFNSIVEHIKQKGIEAIKLLETELNVGQLSQEEFSLRYNDVIVTYGQNEKQLLEMVYIHKPILEACKILGVTKLLRHCGDFPKKIEGLVIEIITEEKVIYIDL